MLSHFFFVQKVFNERGLPEPDTTGSRASIKHIGQQQCGQIGQHSNDGNRKNTLLGMISQALHEVIRRGVGSRGRGEGWGFGQRCQPGFEAAGQWQAILQLLRGIPSNPLGTVQKGCAAQQGRMVLPCLSVCHIHKSVCYILSYHIAPAKHSMHPVAACITSF